MRLINGDALYRKVKRECNPYGKPTIDFESGNRVLDLIDSQPTIQFTDNLQKLADEIASFKRCVKSENSDYLTGYLCALSVVEGMIAEMREVTT